MNGTAGLNTLFSQMYEQKLHDLQSQLAISHMMEKELSVDLEALQEKYDKDQAAAAVQMKSLHDKHSLTVKELSEMVSCKT
jgi:iron-sulfur cluster repair protein YtfE (RIC family)